VELLVTLAVVVILISAAARLGGYVRTRAAVQLTESALAVIDTALEQYYADFGKFPFGTDTVPAGGDGISDPYLRNHLEADLDGMVNPVLPLTEKDGQNADQSFASSAGLFWFLHRAPNSRSIIDALTPSLVTAKYPQTQQHLTVTVVGGVTYDLPRFVDPWGMSLRYEYAPKADVFPRVISAGPDKIFDSPDDIENK